MKHIKKFENTEYPSQVIVNKCKKLFIDVYDDFLVPSSSSFYPTDAGIEIYFKFRGSITNDNFNKYLDFINSVIITENEFQIKGDNIYITVKNVDAYIDELSAKSESNKYNL